MNKLKYLLLFFLAVLGSFSAWCKPRSVYLDKELKDALYINYVQIERYTDSTVLFSELGSYQGYYSYEWFDTENFALQARNEITLLSANIFIGNGMSQSFNKHTTGYVPELHEKVLIVIDKKGDVSLFAHLQDEMFRFWSPFYTGSLAMFHFKPPAIKIPSDDNDILPSKGYESSWDGCLLPLGKLLTYAHQDREYTYRGHAMMNAGNALFIWEFADSEPYFLDGIEVWDEKYNDKTLTVKGKLIQFVNGKSMLMDWEILKVE